MVRVDNAWLAHPPDGEPHSALSAAAAQIVNVRQRIKSVPRANPTQAACHQQVAPTGPEVPERSERECFVGLHSAVADVKHPCERPSSTVTESAAVTAACVLHGTHLQQPYAARTGLVRGSAEKLHNLWF